MVGYACHVFNELPNFTFHLKTENKVFPENVTNLIQTDLSIIISITINLISVITITINLISVITKFSIGSVRIYATKGPFKTCN